MISCMFGGPIFFYKMLLIAKFNFHFFMKTYNVINQQLGGVKAVIWDGNRNNQGFFRLFGAEPQQQWLSRGGVYLFYSFIIFMLKK